MYASKLDSEWRNIQFGDYLTCSGCNRIIYAAPNKSSGITSLRYGSIKKMYIKHLTKCSALRKILIDLRSKQSQEWETSNTLFDTYKDEHKESVQSIAGSGSSVEGEDVGI